MADMFDLLTSSARGCPPLPEYWVPPATLSFQHLPDEDTFGLGFARLQVVFDYLRRGKHLHIPQEWRHLIPKPSDLSADK